MTSESSPPDRQTGFARWKTILMGVKTNITAHHTSVIAAGVAFYGLLGLFPAITALMALAGLMLEPEEIVSQMEGLSDVLPEDVSEIVISQAVSVAESQQGGLGLAAILGLAFALWSASRGMAALIEGLNASDEITESRSFIKLNAINIALTLFLIAGLILSLVVIVFIPIILAFFPLGGFLDVIANVGRWVILAALTIFGISVVYRLGPDRKGPPLRFVTPGAIIACILWVIASIGFSIYVQNFADYNETFGSLGGVIVLLTWLWISAFIILLGAELNSELELEEKGEKGKDD